MKRTSQISFAISSSTRSRLTSCRGSGKEVSAAGCMHPPVLVKPLGVGAVLLCVPIPGGDHHRLDERRAGRCIETGRDLHAPANAPVSIQLYSTPSASCGAANEP